MKYTTQKNAKYYSKFAERTVTLIIQDNTVKI